jgi:hypothetical protein
MPMVAGSISRSIPAAQNAGSLCGSERLAIAASSARQGLAPSIPCHSAKAREKAASYRAVLDDGLDPIDARKQDRAEKQGRNTFGDVANDLLEASGPSWRNAKHRAQWRMTLEVYGKPLWDKPVDEIDTTAVYAVLKPLWQDKAKTASRLRGRIEAVLNRAKVLKLGSGENPATWRGNLDGLLPKAAKLSARGNHAAMPYKTVADFVAKLREREAIDAGSAFVFPGQRLDKPLSNMALEMVLPRMGIHDATVHGFRSAFRDWCGEETHFPREIAEAALAHVIGDKAERAYRRGDALEKRRAMMDAWGNYLVTP